MIEFGLRQGVRSSRAQRWTTRSGLCGLLLVSAAACSDDSGGEASESGPATDSAVEATSDRVVQSDRSAPSDGRSTEPVRDGSSALEEDASLSEESLDSEASAGSDADDGRDAQDIGREAGGEAASDATAADMSADVATSADGAVDAEGGTIPDAGLEADSTASAPPDGASDDASAVLLDAAPVDAPREAVPPGTRELLIVAHPDDDILFANPDLDRVIQSGAMTRTVFLTSGDMGEGGAWADRETRIKTAHADMVGTANDWSCGDAPFAGHTVVQCTLSSAPRDSLVFVRLRDSFLQDLWVRTNSEAPFVGATHVDTMATVDQTQSYTRADVLNVLRAIMADFVPTQISTLDGSLAYGSDIEHHDHIATGLWSMTAAQAYGHLDNFTMYRGYTMTGDAQHEPVNLSPADYARKLSIMRSYDDTAVEPGSQYERWCQRQYPIFSQIGTGTLRLGGQCMQPSDVPAAGIDVILGACTGAATEQWTVRSDGHIAGAGGLCLTTSPDANLKLELAACADVPGQKWLWTVNGQLHAQDANCLTADETNHTVLSATVCGRDNTEYAPWEQQLWAR